MDCGRYCGHALGHCHPALVEALKPVAKPCGNTQQRVTNEPERCARRKI